jgi:hypothetical protein
MPWSENNFVYPGPGAKSCLRRIFGDHSVTPKNCFHLIKWIRDLQDDHLDPIVMLSKDYPLFTLESVEQTLCEVDKFCRFKLENKYLKKRFVASRKPVTCFLPVGLKERFKRDEMDGHLAGIKDYQPKVVKLEGEDHEYVIDKVVAGPQGGKFLVRWEGWDVSWDTWTPKEELVRDDGEDGVVEDWLKIKEAIVTETERVRYLVIN